MIVDGKFLQWEWVTNHYDTHLEGFARVDGRLYAVHRVSEWGNWLNDKYDDDREDGPDNNPFNPDYDDDFEAVRIWGFSWLRYKLSRASFEMLVGRHWSYRHGALLENAEMRSPFWIKFYFRYVKRFLLR